MAVGLSSVKGSVQEAAPEPGTDPGRITRRRQSRKSLVQSSAAGLSEKQKQIRPLQKELKEAQSERDMRTRC
jgi:hypothetical protein